MKYELTPKQLRQVSDLFEAAAERLPAERNAWLRANCGDDEAVRLTVAQLLRAAAGGEGFLETPLLAKGAEPHLSEDAIGRSVGPYRILREIGQGGMSTVYLAVRADAEFDRQVAVKIIWPGLRGAPSLRRFRQERQILARLDHPNIARLLDGGTTADGWPYLVMEYVDGQPITTYCDEHSLSLEDRLRLFTDVCAAVEYAHQQGIVHRDLKPNNILVTPATEGNAGTPKLLDFGIAKLLQPDPHATAAATTLHALTPDYASPEQIRGEEATPGTDVYSLGVLLYELLTGARPYRIKSFLPHEISRAICEIEPEPPSRRIAQLARSRQLFIAAEPDKLRRRLAGDLDNIVMTALVKEPARRYSTPAALAADIKRYLSGQAVSARGNGWVYRLNKRARRHKGLTAGLLSALLGGMIWLGAWLAAAPARRLAAQHTKYAGGIEQAATALEMGRVEEGSQALLTCLPAFGKTDLRGFEWNYLWRSSHQSLLALPHPAKVADAYFACDGRLLLTEAPWQVYWLWETATGRLLESWRAENGSVNYPFLSLEFRHVITVDAGGTFWNKNLCTGERTRLFTNTLSGISYRDFFPGNPLEFVVGHEDGAISFWALGQEQPYKILRGAPGVVERVRIARGGKRMLTLVGTDLLQLWDLPARRVIASYRERVGSAMNFSPDGRHFWTMADHGRLTVREAATGRTVTNIPNVGYHVDGVHLLRPDLFDTAGRETLTLFTFPALKKVFEFKVGGRHFLVVNLSPDGRLLAASTSVGQLMIWDFATKRLLADVKGHSAPIWHFNFSEDGRKLVTAGDDGLAKVWEVAPLIAPSSLEGHQKAVVSVVFSPDGNRLASASFDRTVKLWDAQTGELLRTLTGHTDQVLCIVFSPDGRRLASSGSDGTARVWDVESGTLLRTLPHPMQSHSVAFSPDGNLLATACDDNNVRLWNLTSEQPLRIFKDHTAQVVTVSFSPDGRRLASGSWDKTVKLWEVSTGRELATLSGHKDWVWSAVFSPDGRWLATGSTDRTARLWDLATGQTLHIFTGHRNEIFEVTFSPDGRRLVTASEDRTIRIWNLATGQELLSFDNHTDQVWSVAFSPDGNTLASGSWDKTIRLWRAATAEEVRSGVGAKRKQ